MHKLSKWNDSAIFKADKGFSFVILDRGKYTKKRLAIFNTT